MVCSLVTCIAATSITLSYNGVPSRTMDATVYSYTFDVSVNYHNTKHYVLINRTDVGIFKKGHFEFKKV